jgi:hypothetical protein
MKKPIGVALFAACILSVASCDDEPTTPKSFTVFTGELSGTNEVPANATTATGTIILTLNEKNQLSYNIHWMGLTDTATNAHIHGPGDAATNAPVIVDFRRLALPAGVNTHRDSATPPGAGAPAWSRVAASGGASGTIKLDTTMTYLGGVRGDSLLKLLNLGLLYVNVHTVANPGGEVRAQVVRP